MAQTAAAFWFLISAKNTIVVFTSFAGNLANRSQTATSLLLKSQHLLASPSAYAKMDLTNIN